MDHSNFVLEAMAFCPHHCGGVYVTCSDNICRGFGSHLCAWLRKEGIKIMNDEAFPRENAFRRSNVVIMIISKEYPTSKRCLDDLEMIEKYGENKGILVVCYHMRSEDIENNFENAFIELGSKFPEQMVNIWRDGFRTIVEKDPYKVNIDRNESEIVEDIVRDVFRLMQCVCGLDAQRLNDAINIPAASDWFSSRHGGAIPFGNEYPEGSTGDSTIGSARTQDWSWSDLEPNILKNIATKLHGFRDFAVFSSVCTSWRSVCSDLNWSLCPPHPWSIHFQDQNILNHLDDGRYELERWEIDGKYYYGCVKGWILNIGSQHIHLFNLFSRTQTNLPMLCHVHYLPITSPNDWYRYIDKFILFKACQGNDHQVLVVALFGPRDFIAFTRTSLQKWEFVIDSGMGIVRDVLLFQGRFYALCGRGELWLCAFEKSDDIVSLLSQEPTGIPRANRYYLVNNADHMIGVFQYGNVNSGGRRFNTTRFRIYKFDTGGRFGTEGWTQISQPSYLEDRALFIDNGNSWIFVPLSLRNCTLRNSKTNSIYFTDEYWIRNIGDGHYTGVYGIAEGDIEEFQAEKDHCRPNNSTPFLLTSVVDNS